MANDQFWWRGRLRRTNGNGRALRGATPREYIKVHPDVHSRVLQVAASMGMTVRATMDALFKDLRGAAR